MMRFPKAAEPLVDAFSVAFTSPAFQRVLVLMLGAILSLRQRTVTAMLRATGSLAEGHFSDFHRVLCCRVWSCWPLGRVLAAMVLELIPADQPAVCPVDDTTPQHKGKCVYGKGRHHDACRSTHSHVVWVWGHKWVVLAINVKFPFASRPWTLPVLCALYRPAQLDQSEGQPVEKERAAHRSLPAGTLQCREFDLPSPHAWPKRQASAYGLVRQIGSDLFRRDGLRASSVLVGGFSTAAQTYGYHKTIQPVASHAAGSIESGRMTSRKWQKSS
jgi:hypothetical protein